MSSELAMLVRRLGGEPLSAPAVRETALDAAADVAGLIDRLTQGSIQVIFFQTGVGAQWLFKEAERSNRLPELLAALRRITVVARGPKPAAVLKQHRVPIALSIREPFSTAEIIAALDGLELAGRGVALLHYGERNTELAEALLARQARLEEVFLYQWQLPEDLGPLVALIQDILSGRVDAIAFTSQIQVRHLFQVAAGIVDLDMLREALNTKTVVAAVGPTCAAAVRSYGVMPRVVPQPPKMGPMMLALAEYIEQQRHREPSLESASIQ